MPSKKDHPHVVFLKILYDLTSHKTVAAFAATCDKKQGNMSNYLNGNLVPQKKVLLSCLQNVMTPRLSPVREICEIPEKQSEIPESSGIYIIYDSAGNALYIGRAKNFRTEVWQTLNRPVPVSIRLGPKLNKMKPNCCQSAKWDTFKTEHFDMIRRH